MNVPNQILVPTVLSPSSSGHPAVAVGGFSVPFTGPLMHVHLASESSNDMFLMRLPHPFKLLTGFISRLTQPISLFGKGPRKGASSGLKQHEVDDICRLLGVLPEAHHTAVSLASTLPCSDAKFLRTYLAMALRAGAIPVNHTDRFNRLASNTIIVRNRDGGLASKDGKFRGEVLYVDTEPCPSRAQAALVNSLELPFFVEGQIATRGSRGMLGLFDPFNFGYAAFKTRSGDVLMSLLPIDGAGVKNVVELFRFIEGRTRAHDVMARPLGIHCYRGKLRVLFETMKGRRFPDAARFDDGQIPGAVHDQYVHVVAEAGIGVPSDRYERGLIEADYMFVEDERRFRMGLPVRTLQFGAAVRRGDVFRLV